MSIVTWVFLISTVICGLVAFAAVEQVIYWQRQAEYWRRQQRATRDRAEFWQSSYHAMERAYRIQGIRDHFTTLN